ncbi:hypothetical protein MRY87_00765 [bacterium]|nr:hypothetical protein [bacterium]
MKQIQPVADLHRHLLGSMTEHFVTTQVEKYTGKDLTAQFNPLQRAFLEGTPFGQKLLRHLATLSPETTAGRFRSFSTLHEFLQCYLASSALVREPEDFSFLIQEAIREAAAEQLSYVEFTVSPTLYLSDAISLPVLVELLEHYCQTSEELAVRWLLDPVRNRGGEAALALLRQILNLSPQALCGVSLAGDERAAPLEEFSGYFRLAKSGGLGTTAHIGEGLEETDFSVALELPLDRIGHGNASILCPMIVDAIVAKEIAYEVCLTSNRKTAAVPDGAPHPVAALWKAGARLTLNTDDPFHFETTLQNEVESFLTETNLSQEAISALNENAMHAAFALTSKPSNT